MNDVLQGVNSTLGAVNSVLGGTASSSSSSSSRVSIDSTASSSTISAINKASTNSDVKKLFNEAKPYIEKIVSLAACGASYSQMRTYADSENVHDHMSPFNYISHHKSGCLKVLRIDAIKKKTANAFGFTVTYMSPQSEESKKGYYIAVKQPDGEWLFQYPLTAYY